MTTPEKGRGACVTFDASAGTTYQIAVDGYSGAFGRIFFSVNTGSAARFLPANDDFENAELLVGSTVQDERHQSGRHPANRGARIMPRIPVVNPFGGLGAPPRPAASRCPPPAVTSTLFSGL